MIKHHITKYTTDGQRKATSWIQVNIFKNSYCFNIKTIDI